MPASATGNARREILARLGLPAFAGSLAGTTPAHAAPDAAPEPAWPAASGDPGAPMLALIVTCNHLPAAGIVARSFLAHHPGFRVMLLLVDGQEADRGRLAGATTLLLSDLALPHQGWLAAKLDAAELSNALKPAFLRHLGRLGDRVVYLDCDIAVFAPFTAMLQALETADLVLIPHMLALFPRPLEQWRHPNNADIFNSGLINAGGFAMRLSSPKARQFLEFWHQANLEHAWSADEGRQTDQQFLNWALICCESVTVLRDKSYNVAYWNLHERSLRTEASPDEVTGGLYGEPPPAFTVDDQPLVFFHFSGFDPNDTLRLSHHDQRYSVYTMPAVAQILEWYGRQLLASPHAALAHEPYRFDRLANGVRLTRFLRTILKRYEAYIPRFDASTERGADALCAFLMTPLPATGSLLPLLAAVIYEQRPDLQQGYPGAHTDLDPQGFCRWFYQHAGIEHDVEALVARFRRTLDSDSLAGFVQEVERTLPRTQAGLQVLGADRRRAAAGLRIAGREDLANTLLSGATEWFFFSDFSAVLTVWRHRTDLQAAYPDPFGHDHAEFLIWLRHHGGVEHGLTDPMVAGFAGRTASQVLARLFSMLSRREDLAAIAVDELLADRPERLLRALIRCAGEGLEYDLADVEVFAFLQHRRHASGRARLIPLYLELPVLRRDVISSRTEAGRRAMLLRGLAGLGLGAEALQQDWVLAGCRLHEACFSQAEVALEREIRELRRTLSVAGGDVISVLQANRLASGASQLARLAEQRARRALRTSEPDHGAPLAPGPDAPGPDAPGGDAPGVNLFGYFLASTGVGESSRGLARAAGLFTKVRQIHQFTGHLASHAGLEELFMRYDHHADCNIFVSYPHAHEDLIGLLPREITERRRNVIHLAWEQRDWNTHWRAIYRRYDEIWAISEFAAQPFREMLGAQKVRVVPNVLVTDDLPGAGEIAAARFAQERFRFVFVFDANSSIERKNPEGVLAAFAAAFGGTPQAAEVELVLKVGNLDRPEHSGRVDALRRAARASGLSVHFDGRQLSRRALLTLIGAADCYVSLHRAEGFGYTMAEAMYLGVPVIASGYSGNLEYMDAANSFLVPCREAPVRLADGPFQRGSVWGEPDIEAAASILRHVVHDRAAARAVGQIGAAAVRRKLLPERVAEGLREALRPGAPGRAVPGASAVASLEPSASPAPLSPPASMSPAADAEHKPAAGLARGRP